MPFRGSPSGVYQARVELGGFRTLTRTGVRLAGETIRLDLELEIGDLTAVLATNTPPLGAPNGVFGSAAFGTITSAGDPRVVQLGLKLLVPIGSASLSVWNGDFILQRPDEQLPGAVRFCALGRGCGSGPQLALKLGTPGPLAGHEGHEEHEDPSAVIRHRRTDA